MAHFVCPWWLGYLLVSPLRRWLHDPRVLLAPYVAPGMVVLEPGPGMGFFTLELARAVGSAGRVVAADVQPRMLQGLRRRAESAGLADCIELREVSGLTCQWTTCVTPSTSCSPSRWCTRCPMRRAARRPRVRHEDRSEAALGRTEGSRHRTSLWRDARFCPRGGPVRSGPPHGPQIPCRGAQEVTRAHTIAPALTALADCIRAERRASTCSRIDSVGVFPLSRVPQLEKLVAHPWVEVGGKLGWQACAADQV